MPGNAARGITNHQSTVFLFDPETGRPTAMVGGNLLTALRTAAASSVSIRHLARKDARVLGTLVALDEAVDYALEPGRLYWLHVASGEIEANGRPLLAGDALGFSDEAGRVQLSGRGAGRADVLLFDLPR